MTATPPPGLIELRHEMSRQFADARASFETSLGAAEPIAARIASAGRVLLLGMGASHWANRMVVASYRAVGIRAYAEVLSEHIRVPLPPGERVTLITSQSGASGEISAYFERLPKRHDHFGLTLDGDSPLARAVPVLLGKGGRELPYAATRSIVITLALHAAILRHLGHDDAQLLDVFAQCDPLGVEPPADAIITLAGCRALFLSSRSQLHNALEVASLTFMELARAPATALELGQILHGPLECLSDDMALVLARPVGADAAAVTRLAQIAVEIGMRPILLDTGRQQAVDGAIHIDLPARDGLASGVQLLPTVQRLVIEAAAYRVRDFGRPRRATKVTDGESA